MLKKRELLAGIGTAFFAAISLKAAGESWNQWTNFEFLDYNEYDPPYNPDETTLVSDISDEKIIEFSEKYEITPENAKRLIADQEQNWTDLIALGALSTSLTQDTLSDQFGLPDLAGIAVGAGVGEGAGRVFPWLRKTMTSPDFVTREYDMTSANAEKFCAEHKTLLREGARIGIFPMAILKICMSGNTPHPPSSNADPHSLDA